MQDIKRRVRSTIAFLNKHTILFALLISIILIGLSVGLGWYNNRVVLPTTSPIARYTAEPTNPLSLMSNWDGPDYIAIAEHGYQQVSQASFFPLYPVLIHLVNKVISSPLDSALLISWVCLVGATFYYIKILRQVFDTKDAVSVTKGLLFFVLFPTSIFLVATYTESLFAFLALAAIYYALNKRYIVASLFMLFATVTHLDGVFILALVCLILLEEKVKLFKVIITFVVGLVGLGTYSLYLAGKFASPLSFVLSQKGHGWLNHHYTEILQTVDFFNIIFLILLVLAIIYWWDRRRSFSIYSFLFILIPVIGNQFGGFNRYMLMAFPVQFMAYDYLKNRHFAYSIILAFMGIIWAYFTFQYVGGYIGG